MRKLFKQLNLFIKLLFITLNEHENFNCENVTYLTLHVPNNVNL